MLPVILGCLWLPVLWTVYAFLLPTLGFDATAPVSIAIFSCAIICSILFPLVVYVVYRNVRNAILGGNEAEELKQRIESARHRRDSSMEARVPTPDPDRRRLRFNRGLPTDVMSACVCMGVADGHYGLATVVVGKPQPIAQQARVRGQRFCKRTPRWRQQRGATHAQRQQ
jgi:hypothetical protein